MPSTRNHGPVTAPAQNLADHETLKMPRERHPLQPNNLGGWEDSARTLATWSSLRLRSTSRHTPTQRIALSLHRDSARVMLRRVRVVASRDSTFPREGRLMASWGDLVRQKRKGTPGPGYHQARAEENPSAKSRIKSGRSCDGRLKKQREKVEVERLRLLAV